MSAKEIVCVHLPSEFQVWKDDETVHLVRCHRCHQTWKLGDPDPRVVIAKLED